MGELPADLLPLLGVVAPVLLALLAGFGWVLGRRGPRPPPPPAVGVLAEAHRQSERRIEVAELAHTEAVEEIEGRAALPVEQRRAKAVASWKGRQS